ncbi:hypothetical protein BV20DRAFT_576246 [Pilatotrama ljubarskyi]|nr:hypothetical protein BV20DRAFT_576246 [Pilatotrama ljubarskyi]
MSSDENVAPLERANRLHATACHPDERHPSHIFTRIHPRHVPRVETAAPLHSRTSRAEYWAGPRRTHSHRVACHTPALYAARHTPASLRSSHSPYTNSVRSARLAMSPRRSPAHKHGRLQRTTEYEVRALETTELCYAAPFLAQRGCEVSDAAQHVSNSLGARRLSGRAEKKFLLLHARLHAYMRYILPACTRVAVQRQVGQASMNALDSVISLISMSGLGASQMR